jgi:hypothetical protein
MTFESPLLAWSTLAIAPIAVPVLLAIFLRRFVHIRLGFLVVTGLIAVGVILLFGIAAFFDSRGVVVLAELVSKQELIAYHPDGSWDRKMVATVYFHPADSEQNINVPLTVLPSIFDEIHQGDFVQVRRSNSSDLVHLTRLEDETTMSLVESWLADQPFLIVFAFSMGILGLVQLRWHAAAPQLFFVTALIIIGAWWVSAVALPLWEQTTRRMGAMNSANATVREIHPPPVGHDARAWISSKLFAPYDLVLLEYFPFGNMTPIMAVDMVDFGSVKLQPGQSVNIDYLPSNARYALIPGGSRGYIWKNAVGGTLLAALALIALSQLVTFLYEKKLEREESEFADVSE